MSYAFLTVEDVVIIHREAISVYGGSPEIRDKGLLESAVMAPRQTFGGELLYRSAVEVASAYWHGIVTSHPFVDGNKRAGLMAMNAFLLFNEMRSPFSEQEAEDITLSIAQGRMTRAELADIFTRAVG